VLLLVKEKSSIFGIKWHGHIFLACKENQKEAIDAAGLLRARDRNGNTPEGSGPVMGGVRRNPPPARPGRPGIAVESPAPGAIAPGEAPRVAVAYGRVSVL